MKKFLNNFEVKLIIVIFPIMCMLVLLNVLARVTNLFTQYLTWTEEAARYLMIWMAFLAIGEAAKDNSHFRMSALVNNLPTKAQKIVNLIVNIVSVSFMCILAYYGFIMISTQIRTGQISPIMKVPMWIPYLAIPVGVLNMMIRTVIRVVKEIKYKSEIKEGSR